MSARGKEWAIVLLATRGLADFVENALISIKHCRIDPSLVDVVFPANAERDLCRVAEVFGATPRVLEQLVHVENSTAFPASYVNYGTQEFNQFVRYRFAVLRAVMTEARCVIYADTDVVWLRDPLPYLSAVLEKFPCAFQTESNEVFPPDFCLGFFALAADNPASLKLTDHFIARYASDDLQRPLQPVFRDLIIENPQYLADIFPLPEGLFPCGLLYPAVQTADMPPADLTRRLRPFIFHGNWVRGLDQKRRLLAHAGGWFVPEKPSVEADRAARLLNIIIMTNH
jgi:hypothetical protein